MKPQGQKLAFCFLAGDLCVVAASWVLAYCLRFLADLCPPPPDGIPPFEWCVNGLPLVLILAFVSVCSSGLHSMNRLRRPSHEFRVVLKTNGVLILLMIALMFYRRDPYKSRLVIALFFTMNLAGMMLVRRLAWSLVHFLRGKGFNSSPTLIVGSGRLAQKLADRLRANAWTGLDPIGFVDKQSGSIVQGLPVIGTIEQVGEIVKRDRVAHVFVALPFSEYHCVRSVFDQLADLPVNVQLAPDVPKLAAMSLSTTDLDEIPVIALRTNPQAGLDRLLKRVMDVAIASVGLAVLSPLFGLIATLIKLTSHGPIFYRQVRASLGGEPFQMIKFRTMQIDAESECGPVWCKQNDPRRTLLGSLLRRTSLDELPQLINVLRGEMSIVGPRPERPVFIDKFRQTVPHYMLRHTVKAGITGWAQVHGWRGNTSLRKRVQYDLHYITHWTPWLDLRIMFLTLFRGMTDRNAY